MATTIVPRTHLDLVDQLQEEAGHMKTCIGLMHESLAISIDNKEQVSEAFDRMYFLAASLASMQKKFEALGKLADELRGPQTQAA